MTTNPPVMDGFQIKTLAQLRDADARTLHFLPGGLGVGVRLSEADAAAYQQELMARIELAADVAAGTRMSFDTLRTVWAYGVLCYEIFTLTGDHGLLVIEQALRDRFMELHPGEVLFVHPKTGQHRLPVTEYQDVMDFLHTHGGKYKLAMGASRAPIAFNGMLGGLRRWAHAAGLLRGQRNRNVEQALANLRNFVAHPGAYHLTGPTDAFGKLSDVAEIINQLWGHRTPGGRLYPEPVEREVVVLAWPLDGTNIVAARAVHLLDEDDADPPGWQYMIVRGYFDGHSYRSDPELMEFDARHEVTRFPAQWLWGPGDRAAATEWYATTRPEPDRVDYLDRDFLIRFDAGRLHLPMRPAVAAGLPASEQTGTWYLVRADHPNLAFHHVRSLLTGAPCTEEEICGGCRAIPVASGSFNAVIAFVADDVEQMPDVATPSAGPRTYPLTA